LALAIEVVWSSFEGTPNLCHKPELSASGYAREVGVRLKAEFASKSEAGAEELKQRFPMLRVRTDDSQSNTREEVQVQRA
jgi:hypothetical protein